MQRTSPEKCKVRAISYTPLIQKGRKKKQPLSVFSAKLPQHLLFLLTTTTDPAHDAASRCPSNKSSGFREQWASQRRTLQAPGKG